MARHPGWATRLFSHEDLDTIAATVHAAERGTSGEIRVHLERRIPRRRGEPAGDALARATHVFHRLQMHTTGERNAVLIYVAVEDRKLAIVGDEGVHARVGEEYWRRVRDAMVERLRGGRPRDAIVHAVTDVGLVLCKFFPPQPGRPNQLGDDVSIR
jgi:uncharacterized membrane protein